MSMCKSYFFFFSSRRRHTRWNCDWSSDVCSSDLGAGVRALFSPQGAAFVGGVVGTVADLLDVPPGLEPAVEAALGDKLQWVIVERFEHSRSALTYLEREG